MTAEVPPSPPPLPAPAKSDATVALMTPAREAATDDAADARPEEQKAEPAPRDLAPGEPAPRDPAAGEPALLDE